MWRKHAYAKALQVARECNCIAFPRSCADAALVASYSMLLCEEVFRRQCFTGSVLTLVQRAYPTSQSELYLLVLSGLSGSTVQDLPATLCRI